jgi:hypothetical protein
MTGRPPVSRESSRGPGPLAWSTGTPRRTEVSCHCRSTPGSRVPAPTITIPWPGHALRTSASRAAPQAAPDVSRGGSATVSGTPAATTAWRTSTLTWKPGLSSRGTTVPGTSATSASVGPQ